MEIATQTGHVAHPATGEWARYAIRLEALGDDRVSATGTVAGRPLEARTLVNVTLHGARGLAAEIALDALGWAGTMALLDRIMTQ